MEQLTQPCYLGSRHILHIRKDYSAQHMWWYELGVPSQSNGPSHQLASKSPGFVHSCAVPLAFACDPHTKQQALCGEPVLIAEDSSRFPYCWPSSLRAMSTSLIHLATGLYGCEHSWWKPPPQPMITCFPRKRSLRKPGGTSNLVLLAGPFSSSVTPCHVLRSTHRGVPRSEVDYRRRISLSRSLPLLVPTKAFWV